jgi:ubiquinone/menaquinone biosynthesis C-methylase UbiE
LLEIGVGTGRIALPLAPRVRWLVGVDLSLSMLLRLRSKPGAERVCAVRADAETLPFPDRSFDAVLSAHVVHLLPAWRRVLDEVKRVLVPGGLIVGVRPEREEYPLEVGFRRAIEPQRSSYSFQMSMATFMADIEARVWSTTWRISDAEHAQLCTNMRRVIEARYGSLEAVLELEREVMVRAFTPA